MFALVAVHATTAEVESQFASFASKYGKKYASTEETFQRLAIFRNNLKKIAEHNAQPSSYKLGVTEFADMTSEEFAAKLLSQQISDKNFNSLPTKALPASNADRVNWVEQGKVTPVVNQGSCGSSWAWSAITSLEGAVAIKTKKTPVPLSTQQLIDCTPAPSMGCNGGFMWDAFNYTEHSGICTAEDYKYTASYSKCAADQCRSEIDSSRVSHFRAEDATEAFLQAALEMVPVASAMYVPGDFGLYTSGVYDNTAECKKSKAASGMAVVGFDRADATPYFLLKNTWGANWGEQGYARIALGKGDPCKLASWTTFAAYN